MKIKVLNLTAFGPFTDHTLIFDQAVGGLHIVYGPNEKGKSSALRGLKALLYGIEERTLDNFIHTNDKLRITGCLRNADGRELAFARRKGRKNTLLTLDGQALDEQVLAPFIRGVSSDLFETLFGIDHQALVQGGQEILEQRGEVGQALFSAALGSHALHAVLAQLDDEADDLFRPRGSTQKINTALKSYTELKKEIRNRSLSSREWDEHRRALGRTTKELRTIQFELARNRVEINRLMRVQRILPKLARRRELLGELESLGDVVILSDDFTANHQQAEKERETAQAIIGKTTARLDGLQKQLEGLSIRQDLLDQAEYIEELHARLGGHRKALQDRPHLEAERQQLLTDAVSILKDVRPDLDLEDIEQLRPALVRRQAIAELGSKNAVLISRVEQAESNRNATETRLKIVRKGYDEIPESGSSDALRRAIAAARKQGDMDTTIQSTQSEFTSLQAECAAELSRLSLWDGMLEDLPGLGVPNRESIIRFEEAYDELDKRSQRSREKQEQANDTLQTASLRLEEIRRVGDVPTETDLVQSRFERDKVWKLVRRRWIDGEDVTTEANYIDAEAALPDVFENRMAHSDELSDRLRREADRVHETASLQAQQDAVQRQLEDQAHQLEACAADKCRIDDEWQALWAPCHILPLTPREMRVWVGDLEKLRGRVGQLNLLRQKTAELEHVRKDQIRLLNQQMEAYGKEGLKSETIETVLLECENFAQQLDESKQKRDSLDRKIKDLGADLESLTDGHRLAMEELEAWKVKWRESIVSFGLQGDASPSEVADFIENVRELFAKQREVEKLQIRIKAIDNDAEMFRSRVARIVSSSAPELAELLVDDAVMRLNSLLSDNRTRQTRRQQIEAQLEQAMREIQDSEATIQTMSDRLDSLCVEAKRGSQAELEEAERSSAQYINIKATIAALEQEILEAGDGATIAELELEAQGIDSDTLSGTIEELSNKIDEELEPKRTELAETKGREEKELELMDGNDHAAALADQSQALLARIRSDAERYVRVKIASRVLRDEIERYRKDNQGPLLKRASEHFSILTRSSFQELRTDFNEKDEPVLVGLRPSGERVHVEGMSNGTRDQLYLALRLASLEKYMESAEPMPFIVDDILVDFDDERSQAALNSLAELSKKTQVILFTHHSQVVEQSKQLKGEVRVHEL